MKNYIIDENTFRELKDIGTAKRDKRVLECIEKAQYLDMEKVFGTFLGFLIHNKDNEDYKELYEGGVYGDFNYQLGINRLLASYAYSRYLMGINTTNTAFGAVTKFNQDSQPVSHTAIKDMVKQEQIDAGNIHRGIVEYIKQHNELSKIYESCNLGGNPTYASKIYKL